VARSSGRRSPPQRTESAPTGCPSGHSADYRRVFWILDYPSGGPVKHLLHGVVRSIPAVVAIVVGAETAIFARVDLHVAALGEYLDDTLVRDEALAVVAHQNPSGVALADQTLQRLFGLARF